MIQIIRYLQRMPVAALLCATLCAPLLPAQAADEEDAPERVARLGYIRGEVNMLPDGSDEWRVARLNRPLVAGDRLWVEAGGRAELHVGATALRLDGATAIEIVDLGDEDLRVRLTQGALSIRVREYGDDEYIEVSTPNIGFVPRENGEYHLAVDPDRDDTTLTLRRGSGKAFGVEEKSAVQRLKAGERVRFAGTDLDEREFGRADPRDEFERWVAQRDEREEHSRSARYVSREMIGYQDLDEHGDWLDEPEYGAVWVPRVTVVDWAPYHYGHWTWIAPWGWTWVDDAPWGFAPSHYGRWAYVRSRWCWVPGPIVRRPVYAPALVAFVGGRSGSVSWSVSLSSGAAGVAWFALAPGEPYHPPYARSLRYIERVNGHISKFSRPAHYANQRLAHAIAIAPEHDFQRGAPIRSGHRHTPRERDLSRLPVRESMPIAPHRDLQRAPQAERRHAPPPHAFRHVASREPQERTGRSPGERRRTEREPDRGERRDDAPREARPHFEHREQPRSELPPRNEPRFGMREEAERRDRSAERSREAEERARGELRNEHDAPPRAMRREREEGARHAAPRERQPEIRRPDVRIPEARQPMRREAETQVPPRQVDTPPPERWRSRFGGAAPMPDGAGMRREADAPRQRTPEHRWGPRDRELAR